MQAFRIFCNCKLRVEFLGVRITASGPFAIISAIVVIVVLSGSLHGREDEMLLKSGRHPNKSTEYVFLRFPDDADYIMSNHADGIAGKEYSRHRHSFHKRPFVVKCFHCSAVATRASGYVGSPSLMFWCDHCDPHSQGAGPGRLRTIRSFSDVMNHVDFTCDGYRAWKRDMIRQMAEAKGCPKRLTQALAVSFLA